MKAKTISFYSSLFNEAIKNGNTLKKQCELSNVNISTVYTTMQNLKKTDRTKEESELLKLYETLTTTKTKEVETDDRATTLEIRDENTNEIIAYKFEIYRRTIE